MVERAFKRINLAVLLCNVLNARFCYVLLLLDAIDVVLNSMLKVLCVRCKFAELFCFVFRFQERGSICKCQASYETDSAHLLYYIFYYNHAQLYK